MPHLFYCPSTKFNESEDQAIWALAVNASALDYHPEVQMLVIQLD
jgi:hypothetical protein